ncbi:hypothetical protein V2W45_357620 [Cenococcum geophilum]
MILRVTSLLQAVYTCKLSAQTDKWNVAEVCISLPPLQGLSSRAIKQDSSTRNLHAYFTTQDTAFLSSNIKAPSGSIRSLFDHLRAHPDLAEKLNATYPARGVFETAATTNPAADQRRTLDLSPSRIERIPVALQARLAPFGLAPILAFFEAVTATHLEPLLHALSIAIGGGADLVSIHRTRNLNFRLCDYSPDIARLAGVVFSDAIMEG